MPFVRLFTVFIAMVAFSVCGSDRPPTVYPAREVHVVSADGLRDETLIVELATTPSQRETGLMHRQLMPEDAGMLFLFPHSETGGFWMFNTYLPLTIAYLSADGTVLELIDGKPLDVTPLTPHEAYRHVLEVNQGWFQRHGLGVGSKVLLPTDIPVAK
jgi:hypothetical protein